MKKQKPISAHSHRARLRMKQGGKCCYCGIGMRKSKTGLQGPDFETLEHLRRKADGGDNALDNKALACFRCNSERGEVDWLTYTSYRRGEIFISELPSFMAA